MYRISIVLVLTFVLVAGQLCLADNPCSGTTMPRTIGDLVLNESRAFPLALENSEGLSIAERLAEQGLELHCGEFHYYRTMENLTGAVVQVGRYTLRYPEQPSLLQHMLSTDDYRTINMGGHPVYLREIDPARHPGFQAAMIALEEFSATDERKADILSVILSKYAPYKLEATWEDDYRIYSVCADDEETIRQISRTLLCRPAVP